MAPELYATSDRRSLPWATTVDFSQTVRTNAPLVFTAGQGPFADDGSVTAVGDPAGQIRQTFENLAKVLDAAGASLATVVSQTVYLARAEDFAVFKEVRREYYQEPFPATTTLRVDLLAAGMLVEMSVVAAVGASRSESA